MRQSSEVAKSSKRNEGITKAWALLRMCSLAALVFVFLTCDAHALSAKRRRQFKLIKKGSKHVSKQVSEQLSVNAVERVGSGFSHVVFGAFEVPYQLKEEIKVSDPVRGLIPGLIKGAAWTVAREVVGVFEMATFFVPHKEVLKSADTDWLYA